TPAAVSAAVADAASSRFTRYLLRCYGFLVSVRRKLPWLFVPMLFLAALLEIGFLKLVIALRPAGESALHQHARPIVGEFVEQYPFGAYAVVWKSLQLAFLREKLPWGEMH